jgi:hypothetical protein
MRHLMIKQLLLATCALAISAVAFAAPITWTGNILTGTGTSLISNTGALVEAHNVGQAASITAGGVTFDDLEVQPSPWPFTFVGATSGGLTGDNDFDNILNSLVFSGFSLGSVTMTIDNLSIGSNYLVQFFAADTRNCCTQREVTVDDLEGNSLTGTIGAGFVFTGEFIASANTQAVLFSGVDFPSNNCDVIGACPYLNAWQLRETAQAQVPEPSIIALFGLGLFGIGFARRRIRS